MAKFNRSSRLTDITPHPSDKEAIAGLSDTRCRCLLNPRGQVWELSVGLPFPDELIPKLAKFPKLISIVSFSPTKSFPDFTDDGVRLICQTLQLRALSLTNFTNLTDQTLFFLATNKRIQWLVLNHLEIGDDGIKALNGTNHLFRLGLVGTNVTYRSLPCLKRLTNLRHLVLGNCDFPPSSIQELQESLPNCKIDL